MRKVNISKTTITGDYSVAEVTIPSKAKFTTHANIPKQKKTFLVNKFISNAIVKLQTIPMIGIIKLSYPDKV